MTAWAASSSWSQCSVRRFYLPCMSTRGIVFLTKFNLTANLFGLDSLHKITYEYESLPQTTPVSKCTRENCCKLQLFSRFRWIELQVQAQPELQFSSLPRTWAVLISDITNLHCGKWLVFFHFSYKIFTFTSGSQSGDDGFLGLLASDAFCGSFWDGDDPEEKAYQGLKTQCHCR